MTEDSMKNDRSLSVEELFHLLKLENDEKLEALRKDLKEQLEAKDIENDARHNDLKEQLETNKSENNAVCKDLKQECIETKATLATVQKKLEDIEGAADYREGVNTVKQKEKLWDDSWKETQRARAEADRERAKSLDCREIRLFNIHFDCTIEELRAIVVRNVAEPESIDYRFNARDGKGFSEASVVFHEWSDADKAVRSLDGTTFMARKLCVEFAIPPDYDCDY